MKSRRGVPRLIISEATAHSEVLLRPHPKAKETTTAIMIAMTHRAWYIARHLNPMSSAPTSETTSRTSLLATIIRFFSDRLTRAVLLAWSGTFLAYLQVRTILAFDPRWLAIQTIWDRGWANIYDPFPSIQAAELLAFNPRAPVYAELAQRGSSFIYPPIAAILYMPFIGNSWATAEVRLAWMSSLLFGAILGIVLLFVAHEKKRLNALHAASIIATVMVFYPLVRAVKLNQSTLFVTVFLGLGWLALRKRAEVLAGVALAGALAIKPHLVLMLPILAWRARKTALSALAMATVLAMVSLLFAGFDNHIDYATRVLPSLANGYAFYPNQSWTAFFLRLLTELPINRFEIAPRSATIQSLAITGALVTYASALFVGRRVCNQPHIGPQLYMFAWLAATLISPIAWEHHYAPAIFVFISCWDAYSQRRSSLPARLLPLFAISFVCIASYFEVLAWDGLGARLLMSYVFYGGLLLLGASGALLLAEGTGNGSNQRDIPRTLP